MHTTHDLLTRPLGTTGMRITRVGFGAWGSIPPLSMATSRGLARARGGMISALEYSTAAGGALVFRAGVVIGSS